MNRTLARTSPASSRVIIIDQSNEESPSSNLQISNCMKTAATTAATTTTVMDDWKPFNGDPNASYGSAKIDNLNGPNNTIKTTTTNTANTHNNSSSNGSSEYSIKSNCSGQSRAAKRGGFALSLGTSMLLSFLSIFTFVGMIGTRSPGYNLHLVPSLGSIHRPHRRIQSEFASVDPLRVGIFFDQGSVRVKELPACDSGDSEDLVPCYDVKNATSTDLSLGEGTSDRQCGRTNMGRLRKQPQHQSQQQQQQQQLCLIPPPDEYRVPPRWPSSRDNVWLGNMKLAPQSTLSGTRLIRLKVGSDGVVHLDMDQIGLDALDQHAQLMSKLMFSLSTNQAKIPMVLDINCGLNRIRNRIDNVITLCLSPYEVNGSQVQFSLERGLPAMIGSLFNSQLPFPSFSFDMIHCFDCNFDLTWNDGIRLLELDRLLKPGGIFVHAPIGENVARKEHIKQHLGNKLCWSSLSEDDKTSVWQKASNHSCYVSSRAKPMLCDKVMETSATWYPPLRPCVTTGSITKAKIDRVNNGGSLNEFSSEELLDRYDDSLVWSGIVKSYWSLLSPLLFSDHPKRPGEEDPLPPPNIVRNVMDMNALHGSLNVALLKAKKSAWVMNVIPRNAPDTLSSIYEQGLIGVQHDWCEPFPTYPRTYDLLHGIGVLSQQENSKSSGCGLSNLLLEMDRILRPEGWVILRDRVDLIGDARIAASQMKWETRVISVEGLEEQELLVCQKTFWKVQRSNVS